MFGPVLTARLATMHELQTVYSLEDALNLLEVALVQADNEWKANQRDGDD